MRWAHGFSRWEESFVGNYKRAIERAVRYGVERIVIWGFLRDRHGGNTAQASKRAPFRIIILIK